MTPLTGCRLAGFAWPLCHRRPCLWSGTHRPSVQSPGLAAGSDPRGAEPPGRHDRLPRPPSSQGHIRLSVDNDRCYSKRRPGCWCEAQRPSGLPLGIPRPRTDQTAPSPPPAEWPLPPARPGHGLPLTLPPCPRRHLGAPGLTRLILSSWPTPSSGQPFSLVVGPG